MSYGSQSEKDSAGFVMLRRIEIIRYLPYIKDRRLQLRDIAVLFAMLAYGAKYSGRIKFCGKDLAAELGITPTNLSASISRLKKCSMIAPVYEHGESYYIASPYLVRASRKQNWGHSLSKFKSNSNTTDECGAELDTQN